MMRREAEWLGALLAAVPTDELDPILSVGSGTAAFRMRFQPWIEPAVYAPLAARGVSVLHHELDPAEGVDVSGDLSLEEVRLDLARRGVRTILCLNVFEHVLDRAGLAAALVRAVPPGGWLVVTVPRRFPYHPDPLDTMFRPTAEDLAALFDDVEVIERGQVRCEPLWRYWLAKPGKLDAVKKVARPASPVAPAGQSVPTGRHYSIADQLRMAIGSTEVTFVVMRRRSDGRQ